MVDHTSTITCRYLPSFYTGSTYYASSGILNPTHSLFTGSNLHCLVTEAQVCE